MTTTNAAPLVLTSFKYANNEPCVVSNKSFEDGVKMVKIDDEEELETDSSAKLDTTKEKKPAETLPFFEDDNGFTDEEDEENDENKVNDGDDDDIEWSGDEAELSREISILEQSMSAKREHSPTRSPRKRCK